MDTRFLGFYSISLVRQWLRDHRAEYNSATETVKACLQNLRLHRRHRKLVWDIYSRTDFDHLKQDSHYFFLGGVNLGRLAPSPDLSGRSPPGVRTGLAMFPSFCVGVPFILASYYTVSFPSKLGMCETTNGTSLLGQWLSKNMLCYLFPQWS